MESYEQGRGGREKRVTETDREDERKKKPCRTLCPLEDTFDDHHHPRHHIFSQPVPGIVIGSEAIWQDKTHNML